MKKEATKQYLFNLVVEFVGRAPGLEVLKNEAGTLKVRQSADGKTIDITETQINDVLTRYDAEKKSFIQVNFESGKKILLTESLVGFKPIPTVGLDLTKLPKVVTTPDLISVFEALEEALTMDSDLQEVETLRKVFTSIIFGGEEVGFDLSLEKSWIRNLTTQRASA